MPFRVFLEAMLTNELILLFRRRLVLAPCVSFVHDDVSLLNQVFCVLLRSQVDFDRIRVASLVTDYDWGNARESKSCGKNECAKSRTSPLHSLRGTILCLLGSSSLNYK